MELTRKYQEFEEMLFSCFIYELLYVLFKILFLLQTLFYNCLSTYLFIYKFKSSIFLVIARSGVSNDLYSKSKSIKWFATEN